MAARSWAPWARFPQIGWPRACAAREIQHLDPPAKTFLSGHERRSWPTWPRWSREVGHLRISSSRSSVLAGNRLFFASLFRGSGRRILSGWKSSRRRFPTWPRLPRTWPSWAPLQRMTCTRRTRHARTPEFRRSCANAYCRVAEVELGQLGQLGRAKLANLARWGLHGWSIGRPYE